jgi:hypothetical protein
LDVGQNYRVFSAPVVCFVIWEFEFKHALMQSNLEDTWHARKPLNRPQTPQKTSCGVLDAKMVSMINQILATVGGKLHVGVSLFFLFKGPVPPRVRSRAGAAVEVVSEQREPCARRAKVPILSRV